MNAVMKAFTKLQDVINNLIAAVMMIMMCIVLAQTLGRAVHMSIPWSEEASRYLFVVMILLGINLGISKNMMVRIDIVDKFMSKGLKIIFDVIREFIGILIAGVFFYSTFSMIRVGALQKSPALQLNMSVIYTVMAVGFGLAVLASLIRLIKIIQEEEEEEDA